MATRFLAAGPNALRSPPSDGLREEDYRNFCAALESTQRGRDFLAEYGRRNRNADTEMLLDALDRIETMMTADGAARDRLRDELRVLLIAIRLARPDIDSATALTKAARLVDLLDLMEHRIDAMVENKDLTPIAGEPLAEPFFAAATLSVVPRPDEPELPIPTSATMQPPPMALVQDVIVQGLPPESPKQQLKQELKQELPSTSAPLQAPPRQELADQESPGPDVPGQQTAHRETAIEALAKQELLNQQEALLKARRRVPADPYPLFADENAAVAPPAAPPAPEEKWLPDFSASEAQIIHTQPVRSMAFMPEVVFSAAPAAVKASPATPVAENAAPTVQATPNADRPPTLEIPASPAVAMASAVQFVAPAINAPAAPVIETAMALGTAGNEASAEAAAVRERLRNHPLAAIMSLSEEERIALFT